MQITYCIEASNLCGESFTIEKTFEDDFLPVHPIKVEISIGDSDRNLFFAIDQDRPSSYDPELKRGLVFLLPTPYLTDSGKFEEGEGIHDGWCVFIQDMKFLIENSGWNKVFEKKPKRLLLVKK